ncbi:MAG: CocE/NonD family hydrolase [Myxococcota bacterium]|nr:CocE/NonD family hydrolase [Myxococcota bacterium]
MQSARCLPAVFALAVGCAPAEAPFQVRESVHQLHITHATPGMRLAVLDGRGVQVQIGTADALGSLVFRQLPAGDGYIVRTVGVEPPLQSRPLRVLSVEQSTPPPGFYAEQKLGPGFGYIRTRDGTLLSAYVTLPGPPEEGPYPTVVTYSGYDPSRPGKPIEKYAFLCKDLPALCDPPTDPGALLASLFGYATVGVNMRGTGCSGGAYDFFETLQVLDGYDIIQTVAAQPWVLHGKVGMVGLSYPGISQLFVAAAQPPSLAAITPLSVIGSPSTTLAPGGIFNNGFAVEWIERVLRRADPYGQGWERERVEAGDSICAENQLLHGQKADNLTEARNTLFYEPERLDPLNPTHFAPRIQVPVFLAGSFQDEQTGPFFTTLLDRFTGAALVRLTVYNGVHIDGFAPQVLSEWKSFLDLFVARRVPEVSPQMRALSPLLFRHVFDSDLRLPPLRFDGFRTHEEALAAYRAEPSLRVIFENGAGAEPGAPQGTFERTFPAWPPPQTQLLRYYLHADGSLRREPPTEVDSASSFQHDPEAGSRGILAPGGDSFDKLPQYDYRPLVQGRALAFETAPLTEDLVLLGTGSADLYVRSTAEEADLEVNLTEVRPDGQEMYVQSGWLRASHRALAPSSTPLWPEPTHRQRDWAPLVPGQWVSVRIAIAGFGHVFRKGSRIRLSIDTPGDSRASWRFALAPVPPGTLHSVAHAAERPSSVALPLVAGVQVPSPLPPCPSLRGQPCRAYVPLRNNPAR